MLIFVKMRIYFKILALIFLVCTGEIFSQWITQNSGIIYALKSVYFTNEMTGFACGYDRILKTTSSGSNWQSSIVQGNHNSIKFTDALTGFVCSDNGKIFKTTNSGEAWFQLNSGVTANLKSLSFLNSQTGIAAGSEKTIIKTTDGGASWFNIANFIWQVDFLSAEIIDANKYYVSGQNTFIMRTTDGGTTWVEHTHGEPNPMFDISFINSNTGFVTGCCGMFLSTTNGGSNWVNEYYLSLGFTFYSMQFVNEQTGYAVGDNGMIYRTTNGRAWWDSTVTNTVQSLYSIHMVNQNTGWVVGGYGTILKTTNGGGQGFTIGINNISSQVPADFELFQNYPNPFNPVTRIRFNIAKETFAALKIFNAAGEEVAVLVNGVLPEGTYETEFNGSYLPSGVYFCRMEYESGSITRKMALIK